jgi:hypothetical protein
MIIYSTEIFNGKKTGVMIIPVMSTTKSGGIKRVKNYRLLPGYNQIEDEFSTSVLETIKEYLESGRLKVEEENSLEKIKPDSLAKKIVESTFNVDTLKKYYEVEIRPEIRVAISEQIKKIKNFKNKVSDEFEGLI